MVLLQQLRRLISRQPNVYQCFLPKRCLTTSDAPRSPQLSTVHQGNAFEKRSMALLHQNMSMSLQHVGGKEDGGIDLVGWWWLPHDGFDDGGSRNKLSVHPRRRLRVIAQCKAEKKKMGPKYVRELEGVMHRFLAHSAFTPRQSDTLLLPTEISEEIPVTTGLVALLISESAFTKSTILRAVSSPIPFILLHLPPLEGTPAIGEQDGSAESDVPGSILCNPALISTKGILKGQLEVRWERYPFGGGQPGLWWKEQKLLSWTPDIGATPLSGIELHRKQGNLANT